MKLQSKLMLVFLTILFVPVLLLMLFINVFQKTQLQTLQEKYQTENILEAIMGNGIQTLNAATAECETDILEQLNADPDAITESGTLLRFTQDLDELNASLVVIRDGAVIYSNYPRKIEHDLKSLILNTTEHATFEDGGVYLAGDENCFVKQQMFEFRNGDAGRVCIITEATIILPEVRNLAIRLMISLAAALVLIAFTLTMWLYYTLLRPINELQKATQEIKEGNLDYVMDIYDDDEIGQLCSNFEEMRLQLKQTAQEKLEYDRESKELISNISHDLKTPITAIKGYVEGIMDGVASSPEKQKKYLRTIYNKACDMDRLIDELTFYSKIDTNKIPYSFVKLNVSEYFSDCVSDLKDELEAQNIEFRYRNRVDDETMIVADAEQMKRVINNIIGNSVKYMDKPKQVIHMDILDVGDQVQINIEDNGRGIANADLPNIFERFYRTDASRNSQKGGSGIGLSIVRKIIADHGGKIWATSVEGEGTTMHIVLRKYREEEYEQNSDY